jgi:hypothetical protein
MHLEGNPAKSDDGRLFERLEKGAPAAARRRKIFFEGCNAYGGFEHDETYSASAARRQSVREEEQPASNRKLISLHGEGPDSPVECKRANLGRTSQRRRAEGLG